MVECNDRSTKAKLVGHMKGKKWGIYVAYNTSKSQHHKSDMGTDPRALLVFLMIWWDVIVAV